MSAMNAYKAQADLLKTIAHPTRLAILDILRDGEQCVCHMEAVLGLRQASISQQLMVLRRARVVRIRREGLNIFYRVAKPEVLPILDAGDAAAGKPRPRAARTRARGSCSCPKCTREQRIPLHQLSVRG